MVTSLLNPIGTLQVWDDCEIALESDSKEGSEGWEKSQNRMVHLKLKAPRGQVGLFGALCLQCLPFLCDWLPPVLY